MRLFARPLVEENRIFGFVGCAQKNSTKSMIARIVGRQWTCDFNIYFIPPRASDNIAYRKWTRGVSKSECLTYFKHFDGALDRPPLEMETFFASFTVAKGCLTMSESSIQHCKMTLYVNFFNDAFQQMELTVSDISGALLNSVVADHLFPINCIPFSCIYWGTYIFYRFISLFMYYVNSAVVYIYN